MAKVQLLQDITIKKAKSQEKEYFLNDGGGLRIAIKPSGHKIWEYRYTINGKRRRTTFKSYPIVTVQDARTKRQEYESLINNGLDPIEYFKTIKKDNILDEKGMFLEVAKEWLKRESENTKENTHSTKVEIFEKDINPFLKNKHISEVTKDDVLKIIKFKEIQAPNVANKIFIIFKSLFNHAVFKGYVTKNIFENTKEEKKNYIKPTKVKHYSKITD